MILLLKCHFVHKENRMKLRGRLFVCALTMVAISLWSTSALAQSSLTVSSVPRTTAIATGHTEIAGDLLVQAGPIGANGAGAGQIITVDYGVPITVPITYTPNGINVIGAGALAGAGPGGAYCAAGVANVPVGCANNPVGTPGTFVIGGPNQNQLLISVPTAAANPGPISGSITVTGVKVSLAALTPPTTLNAVIGVTAAAGFGAYSVIAGQNIATAISLVAPAFTTVATPGSTATPPGQGQGSILNTGTVSDRLFTIDIPENFVDAFKSTLGVSGYLNDTALQLTFSGIPAGVNLNLAGGATGTSNGACSTATTDGPQVFPSGVGAPITTLATTSLTNNTINSGANSTIFTITAGMPFNPSQLETVRIRGCIFTSGTVGPIVVGQDVSVAVTMAPTGVALNAVAPFQINPVAGNFPRFANSPISATVIRMRQAITDLLVPFAVRSVGFDTGIAIANTSDDPHDSGRDADNAGTIMLTFMPQTGSSFSLTTSGTGPGTGLSAGGVLGAGRTWSVLLSELMAAVSGAPTSFTGQIYVRTNFTLAHGAAFVTNFTGFTSASPVLVLNGEGLNN
jgi:hypothetical protein